MVELGNNPETPVRPHPHCSLPSNTFSLRYYPLHSLKSNGVVFDGTDRVALNRMTLYLK
jgi:hypothetical protein